MNTKLKFLSRSALLGLISTGLLVTAACGDGSVDNPAPTDGDVTTQTGMALSLDLNAGEDVAYFRYRIRRVACFSGEMFEPLTITETEPISDLTLPGDIPGFEGDPFADGSSHPFADHYEVLPAGCYNVRVTPLDEDMNRVEECTIARRTGVQVFDGETTEIILVSQCEGGETGGLDVIAGVNYPPTIVALEYQPSKFIYQCERVTLCATATDPDGDPIEFTWDFDPDGPFNVISYEQEGDTATECIRLHRQNAGAYDVTVTAWDLTEDGQTMEEWLNENGNPGAVSQDSLDFPLYVSGQMPPLCFDNGDLELEEGAGDHNFSLSCLDNLDWDFPVCD